MSNSESETEAKLEKLSQRIELGWEKLNPITETERDTVRRAIQEEWQQQQTAGRPRTQTQKGEKQPSPTQEEQKGIEQANAEQERKKRGHGHGY